eukprot:UN23142
MGSSLEKFPEYHVAIDTSTISLATMKAKSIRTYESKTATKVQDI